MPRLARLALLCVAALAAIVAAGCGNKEDKVTLAETEGIYVTVDDLKYQIQISRILNPAAADDAYYLRGLPAGEELADDEVWYGIFMRVENDTDDPHPTAEQFTIKDTQGTEFEPIELDPQVSDYVYEQTELQAGKLLPTLDTPASDNTIRGALILFKVKTESLGNRPLELEIHSPSGGENAVIDIDV
jgi:hypothetical protein